MNRKNTILIAVMINSGLLAVLLITALTSQEEIVEQTPLVAEAPMPLPAFDDRTLFNQEMAAAIPEPVVEAPVHKIPVLEQPIQEPVVVMTPPAASSALEVTVKKGDTLEKIAKAHQVSVSDLIKGNHLPSNFLKVGQVLKIPAGKAAPEKQVAAAPVKKVAEHGPEYYTMKVGESPWAIAMKHHMKVEELLRLNGLNEEKARKLKAGDRLRIR